MEVVYPIVETTAKGTIKLMGYDVRTEGHEHIPREGGAVLASNHIGYLDFIFVGYAALQRGRRARFLAKKEIWERRSARVLMNAMGHIPVDRAAAPRDAFAAAEEALRAGEIVGMFPESTISPSFVPRRGKTGSARLAMAAGVPLIPVAVWGTQRILTKGRPKNLERKIALLVHVGAPIPTRPEDDPRELTDELMRRVGALLEDAQQAYPQRPKDEGDAWWLPVHLGGTAPTPEEVEDRLPGPGKEFPKT
jgi:1-acyl-sn-glycerol-3-phosphate acyltransferase